MPQRKTHPKLTPARIAELEKLAQKIDREEGDELRAAASADTQTLPLPEPLPSGNYPALQYIRTSIARDIVRDRQAKGWSRQELARRAGVRRETLGRIESARHAPTKRTLEKIDKALASE